MMPVVVYASTTEGEDSGSGAETETTTVLPITTVVTKSSTTIGKAEPGINLNYSHHNNRSPSTFRTLFHYYRSRCRF